MKKYILITFIIFLSYSCWNNNDDVFEKEDNKIIKLEENIEELDETIELDEKTEELGKTIEKWSSWSKTLENWFNIWQ